MGNARNIEKDIMKGILIFLVVLGHAQFPGHRFIYLFHMSCFFIVSGYFWKTSYITNRKSTMHMILKRIKTLYIPFVFFNILFLIVESSFPFIIPENIKSITFSFLFLNFVKIIFLRGRTILTDSTWFLSVLFIVTVLYTFIMLILKKFKIKENTLCIIISLISLFLGGILSYLRINIYEVGTIFSALSMYSLGNEIKNLEISNKFFCKDRYKLVILSFIFLILLLLINHQEVRMIDNSYPNILYFYFASIFGYIFTKNLSDIISDSKYLKKYFIFFGEHSMAIMCLHMFAFKFVIALQCILNNTNVLQYISSYPVYYANNYWWIVYTIVGVILPLIIVYFINKLLSFVRKDYYNYEK